MTNQLIASTIAFNHYRDCATRADLIDSLRAELMLTADDPTDDDILDAIDRDIRDALHNTNLDFMIPAAMLNDDRFDRDDALDATFDFILDNFDPALILLNFPLDPAPSL